MASDSVYGVYLIPTVILSSCTPKEESLDFQFLQETEGHEEKKTAFLLVEALPIHSSESKMRTYFFFFCHGIVWIPFSLESNVFQFELNPGFSLATVTMDVRDLLPFQHFHTESKAAHHRACHQDMTAMKLQEFQVLFH